MTETFHFTRRQLLNNRSLVALTMAYCREFRRRMNHPYYRYVPDDDSEGNQLAFHKSTRRTRLVYGGNQSGKSKVVGHEISWWSMEEHPYQDTPPAPHIYVISAAYRTIQEGVYRHLVEVLPDWEIVRRGPLIPGGWKIPSYIEMRKGGVINFISGEGKEDARRKLAAAAIDLAVVDEEVDLLLWEELQARRLARGGRVVISATLHRSEEWCTELEDRAEAGDPTIHLVRLSTYRARERGHVDRDVVAEMEATLPESERRVRLLGQSRKGESRIYPEFGEHCLIDPFPIPPDWTRYCAWDPGHHTFAILWAAVAPGGDYYLYREIYEHAAHYRKMAAMWYAAMRYSPHATDDSVWLYDPDKSEKCYISWIDPSAFGHTETGEEKTGNLVARDCGIELTPAPNGVEAGIELCRGSLIPGMDGRPRMHVFRTLTRFCTEIVGYRRPKDTRDPNRAEPTAKPIKRKDHLMDAWRYLELGGLYYVPPPDPRYERPRDADDMPWMPPAGESAQDAIRRNWQRIMDRQKEGRRIPAHVSGIGSEY